MRTHIYAHTYTHMLTHIIYTYAHIHTYVHTQVYTYAHTHAYTNERQTWGKCLAQMLKALSQAFENNLSTSKNVSIKQMLF